ncbi:MAG: hypothetical protein Q7T55_05515 [Solirubrobacteraceae bacterium]|nr:hypothetical protein [Solirubrobacteraceae bacterium]
MPALRSVHHLRRAVLTTALLLASAATPAVAAPAPITVKACAQSDEQRTDAWVRSASTAQPIDFIDRCNDARPASVGNVDITHAFGLNAAPESAGLTAQPGRVAGYTITAPTDAAITALQSQHAMTVATADWEIRVRAGATVISTCAGPTTATKCADGATDRRNTPIAVPAGTKSLDIGVYCVAAVQCSYGGGADPAFSLVITGAAITVADTTPPTVSTPTAAGQINGRLSGDGFISVGGSDPTGVRLLEVLEGTKVIGEHEGECVDWSMRPCAEPSIGAGTSLSAVFTVDELGLRSGSHVLRTRVTDAAGITTLSDPMTVIVDETLGAATVTGGGRSNSAIRDVNWTIPDGMNVKDAKVELCTIVGIGQNSQCTLLSSMSTSGPVNFKSEAFPAVKVRVRLTSEGGAVTHSEPVDYIYDTDVPKPPKVKLVESTGELRVLELTADPADTDADSYYVLVCPAPGFRCSPLATGKLPEPGAAPIRVSTRLTSLANVRVDLWIVDSAGNQGMPAQVTLTPTAKDLGITPKNGNTPGGAGGSSKLVIIPKLPAKLPKGSSVVIKGTTPPGAASKVTITIAGRNKKNKAVSVKKVAKVAPGTGAFAVRLKLPKKLNRKKGLLVTIEAAPNKGWVAAKARVRLKG